MLNLSPDLFLLHDVITDTEAEQIKEIATPLVRILFPRLLSLGWVWICRSSVYSEQVRISSVECNNYVLVNKFSWRSYRYAIVMT